MKIFYPELGIGKLCRLFGKSRQGWYELHWAKEIEHMQEMIQETVSLLSDSHTHTSYELTGHELAAIDLRLFDKKRPRTKRAGRNIGRADSCNLRR